MKRRATQFPDTSAILAQKAAGRRERAALSFAEKLMLMDALKERIDPIVQAREFRRNRRSQLEIERA